LYRKFVETSGWVEWLPEGRLRVQFDRGTYNPILREAALDQDSPAIPWRNNTCLEFTFR
jgi:hypothetical protein